MMLSLAVSLSLSLGIAGVRAAVDNNEPAAEQPTLRCWPERDQPMRLEYEQSLIKATSADELKKWHELTASEPHVAGTPGDLRQVARIADAFRTMGLEVEEHEFWAYLARPISTVLQVISPVAVDLAVKENILAEDPYTSNPDLTAGWNAYSGNGDVTCEVVYANFGTKADFEKLVELGVDVKGKIVLARYGGNFRGYKAKFAEQAGAAGLIIYTDPADSGYCKGLMYPEGGFANDTCIQRGSILTLDYIGDPLTPFVEATKDAARVDEKTLGMPRIPVQPVGWASAQQIIGRMKGAPAPTGWTGGLPFPYRLTGGPELKVRLKVEQERSLVRTYNVVATLKGSTWPDELMVIGCHHDAWGYGAADPAAGTMVLLEAARVMSDAARSGKPPARSVVFAAWGAEEFGIIGSTEWVEANRDRLVKNGVGYINLDMASMGNEFGSAATPSMQQVIADVARCVPQSQGKPGETVFENWLARSKDALDAKRPRFGDLGGGSDHAPFVCHAVMPAASIGSGGSQGTSYHSTYDTLKWYRQTVGEDYQPALMNTRMTILAASRLADAPILPLGFANFGKEVQRHLRDLIKRGGELGLSITMDEKAATDSQRTLARAWAKLDSRAVLFEFLASDAQRRLTRELNSPEGIPPERLGEINRTIIDMDRSWLVEQGIPGRPWFRNLFVANDEDSGYASWMLPSLRHAAERKDLASLEVRANDYIGVFDRLVDLLGRLHAPSK